MVLVVLRKLINLMQAHTMLHAGPGLDTKES